MTTTIQQHSSDPHQQQIVDSDPKTATRLSSKGDSQGKASPLKQTAQQSSSSSAPTEQSTAINTHALPSDYDEDQSTLDLASLPPLEGFEFRDLLWQQVDVMDLKVADKNGKELKLMTYRWQPDQPDQAKGVIFMIHGYGANAAQMAVIAKYLAQNDYDVFSVDMRGHGDSGGEKGIFESADQMYSDLWAFIFEAIKKFKINQQATPLFLMGRSFGGLLVTNMANTLIGKSMFKAVILVSPYYRLFTERLYEVYKYLVPMTWVKPNHKFYSEFSEMDEEYAKTYHQVLTDPRNVDFFTATTARAWVEEQEKARTSIGRIAQPICFVTASQDGVVRNDYIEDFARLAHNQQNEFHEVQGADHTDIVFNKHFSSHMIRAINNFLDRHCQNINTNNNGDQIHF